MNSVNGFTYSESKSGASLHWTIRVDASGSRVEWCTVSNSDGWVCHLGDVHNDGVGFGSKIVTGAAEEKALLDSLRMKVFGQAYIQPSAANTSEVLAA